MCSSLSPNRALLPSHLLLLVACIFSLHWIFSNGFRDENEGEREREREREIPLAHAAVEVGLPIRLTD